MPIELAYLWDWFIELAMQRTSGGFAANPITFSDIGTWAQLTGTIIRASEVRLIVALDGLYRTIAAEASDERRRWLEQQRPQRGS